MLKKRDDDHFKDTTMTFGEHLDDLRMSLVKALLWLVAGVAIGLVVGNLVVAVIKAPLSSALGTYYESKAVTQYQTWRDERLKAKLHVPYSVNEIRFMVETQHYLYDIRYSHPSQMLNELVRMDPGLKKLAKLPAAKPGAGLKPADLVPIFLWTPVEKDDRINPTTLSAQEGFSIWFKASLVIGIVISSPMVFYHIWEFVAAGLYPHEKRYVHVFLPFSIGLFLLGAATAYLFVFKPVLDFLFSFNQWLGLDPDPRISEWLGFVLFLPLGFGVSFQLPLVMLFLERIGIFSIANYVDKWRIAVLVIFILSAILTPADPYSLLLMALPLTLLYGVGLLLCKWWSRGGKPVARTA